MDSFVIGVSGASGIILSCRLIRILADLGHKIELVLSQHALYTATIELGKQFGTGKKFLNQFSGEIRQRISLHAIGDIGCSIASGSFPVKAMVIIPCSMATLAALAVGLADNALRRAADVTLKEKRPLILVPRETPFNELHLENMLKLSRIGATILPPIPAWYTEPKSLSDIENFIVGKVLDVLHIEHSLYKKWKGITTS
jgi:flavin prenyltransferase